MIVRFRGLLATMLLVTAAPLAAQGRGTLMLRGRIVAEDSMGAAGFATVELAGVGQHFAEPDGSFTFGGLPPGRYTLRVRQLGFTPRDTVVQLGGATAPVVLRLRRVPIVLEAVRVAAPRSCQRGGVDTAGAPEITAIFSAVRENAARAALLQQEFPFEYTMQDTRTIADDAIGLTTTSSPDTVTYRSEVMVPYAIGHIVFDDSASRIPGQRMLRIPTIFDLVDPTFVATHCIRYGGVDEAGVRVRFTPFDTLRVPDVEGTITLDTLTFVLRSAVVQLTHPGELERGYQGIEVKTTYHELLPRLAVVADVAATQRYRIASERKREVSRTEKQHLIALRFLGSRPVGSPAVRRFP